jgi:hypothetical protein
MGKKETDEYQAEQIELWMDNDYSTYVEVQKKKKEFVLDYGRKMKRGVFNHDLAKKGIKNNIITPIARQLQNQFCDADSELCKISSEARELAAEEILKEIEQDAQKILEEEPEKLKIHRSPKNKPEPVMLCVEGELCQVRVKDDIVQLYAQKESAMGLSPDFRKSLRKVAGKTLDVDKETGDMISLNYPPELVEEVEMSRGKKGKVTGIWLDKEFVEKV